MAYKYIINPVELSKFIMDNYLKEGMVVCDCTVGNGNDTLYLRERVGEEGRVYGFDIQKLAIDNTEKLLKSKSLDENVELFLAGHEKLDSYIKEEIDLFIYNLGYLPRADKSIKTNGATSVSSMDKALKLLKNNGILLVTCYTGHEGGLEEKNKVEKFLSELDQKEYNVLEFNFKNQRHCPPILYAVEKK